MNQPPKKIDQDSVTWSTEISLERIQKTKDQAIKYVLDPDKKIRVEKSFCIPCYYQNGRVGGAAMTVQPCGICLVDQRYSSTATDALCFPCASNHSLCKQCGADLALKPRRKFNKS
jgi:predicted  nucleic acid-binding Zn ribbon protein